MRGLRRQRIVYWSLLVFGLLVFIGAGGCSSDGGTTRPGPSIEDPGPHDPTEGVKVRDGDLGTNGESGS